MCPFDMCCWTCSLTPCSLCLSAPHAIASPEVETQIGFATGSRYLSVGKGLRVNASVSFHANAQRMGW